MTEFSKPLAGLKSIALNAVRRGSREILWTPPKVNLGNHFYYWLHAFHRQRQGDTVTVLVSDEMSRWSGVFPRIFEELTTSPGDVGFRDIRTPPGAKQTFGGDFDEASLDAFIDRYVLDAGGELGRRIERQADLDLTVNVRRGDYYSVPRWRGIYSFDVVEYVRVAVGSILNTGEIGSIRIVSDDPSWCRAKLSWLSDIAPVQIAGAEGGPLEHLAILAGSPRLVLANSSFSYWGGYISDRLRRSHGRSERSEVWAPRFNSRALPNGGRATQLNPRWNVIDDIPGGWDG